MGIEIESSQDGNKLIVNGDGRALVEANSARRSFFVSRDEQRVFNIVYNDAGAVAAEQLAYLKNTSQTRLIVIDLVRVGADANVVWNVHKVEGDAVGVGVAPIPVNMNFGSGIVAEAETAVQNIAGLTSGGVIASDRQLAGTSVIIPFDNTLILPPDTAMSVQYLTGAGGEAAVTIRMFYEPL